MLRYVTQRLLLMIPTLLGIMVLNFLIVQIAPGGPVEKMIARITHSDVQATARFSGTGGSDLAGAAQQPQLNVRDDTVYRGARGLDPALIKEIERMYGFDKPPSERFVTMMMRYIRFDFGTSFYRDTPVISLIGEKLPVSISLGLWTTLLVYLISIPLGIAKAVRSGSRFDTLSSFMVVAGYAIPSFLFAILLIILFAGGSYVQWFPLRGLVSDHWESLSWTQRILDYAWHMILPVSAMVIGGFAGLTMLTKNAFLEEIHKQYAITARAKGASERRVLYGHLFRNAMLIVIAGFPAAFIRILFTSSLLIEVIFSLDGLGLLGFEAAINRDYPVMFGALYIFTLLGLCLNLLGDLMYMWIDPRIDFARR